VSETHPNQNQLLFQDEASENLFFLDDESEQVDTQETWKILIVDDDPQVHKVTRLALNNFKFEEKSLDFINAYSGEEAKQLIQSNPDIATILLDVVMEKDDSGLDVVNYVRFLLKNEIVQIILRTGQAGKCPENVVIFDRNINDYKTKTELTKSKLVTAVVTALKNYSSLTKLDSQKAELEKLAREKNQLYHQVKDYSQLLEVRVEERTREVKAKEARLAISEAALLAAQKLAHLGNFEFDFATQELTGSDELFRILGLECQREELSFNLLQKLIHPDDREFWLSSITRGLVSGNNDSFEVRVRLADGSIRYIFTKLQVIKDAQRRVIKLFGTIQDISDRKEIEAKLQKALEAAEVANRTKNEFIANISHEIRSPLNGILGYAQILQRDPTATAKQLDGINIIYHCGSHLLTLINDLLDIAKIEARKMELYLTEFHFSTFLFNIQQIFRLRAEQKQIAFIYQPSPQLPTAIRADEKRLRQVLINLLSNAIKFTHIGHVAFKIDVIDNEEKAEEISQASIHNPGRYFSLEETSGSPSPKSPIPNRRIRFQIEDTGVGMTPDQLSKIFLPFEQVGDTSRKAEGIGLGLAITKNLVSLMGGELSVESSLGRGSVFRVELALPLASVEIDSPVRKPLERIVGFHGEIRKILVVDDVAANRSVIIDMLEPLGFEVIEAANGREGMEKALHFQPDLIITNLMMPVMDGFEMMQCLRCLPEFHTTPAIAASASVYESDRQKSFDVGCNDFIAKPIRSEELLDKIQTCLGLVWITKSLDASIVNHAENDELIPPSPSELVTLYQAAQIGDIGAIETEATRLKQLSPQYFAFANKLLQLAQEFEEQEILQLVEQYIPKT
jgi:PAS domain S-box-containing protein